MRQLAYNIQPAGNQTQKVSSILKVDMEEDAQKSVDLKNLEEKFPKLFTRRGKFKGEKVKANFKENIKPTKHKGRRVPPTYKKVY